MDEAQLLLKHALDASAEWAGRCEEVSRPNAISAFLRGVALRVPYYREQFGAWHGETPCLSAFPIINRQDHEVSRDRFMSLGRNRWDPRLAAYTNGTLGSRLRVQFDPASWYDINYGTFAAVADRIDGLRERMVPGKPCIFLVTDTIYQPKAPPYNYGVYIPTLNSARLQQLVIGGSDDEDLRTIRRLRFAPTPLLYGKPSVLLQLADLDRAIGTDGRIRAFAILVSGEALYEDQRGRIENWFGAKVLNAYAATEGGLIALECIHRSGLHVHPQSIKVEVLSAKGEVSDAGSGEIIITNLFNHAHVFVRYRLGDEVEIKKGTCSCGFTGQTIVALHAREARVFSTALGTAPVNVFRNFLLSLPLKGFQVVQHGLAVPVVKWTPVCLTAESIAQIAATINQWLSSRDWRGSVDSVPVCEITPRGGKQRRFIRDRPRHREIPRTPAISDVCSPAARDCEKLNQLGALVETKHVPGMPSVMVRRFERAAVVSWAAGSFLVIGTLLERWAEDFAAHRALPISDTIAGPDASMRSQQFAIAEDGMIWTLCQTNAGAFWVKGKIRDKWYQLGALHGLLGAPAADGVLTADGCGVIQHFLSVTARTPSGAIVMHPRSGGPFAIHGAIYERWTRAGFESDVMGLPESDVLSCGDGRGFFTQFGGAETWRIYSCGPTAVIIRGAFYTRWSEADRESGELGYPITEDTLDASSQRRTMIFENGVIWVSPEGEVHMELK